MRNSSPPSLRHRERSEGSRMLTHTGMTYGGRPITNMLG